MENKSTKTVLRQHPQTPQTPSDAENRLYPSIPMQRMGQPQPQRTSRPPPLRQDTVDMEVVPLNRTQSQQEADDRHRAFEIFNRVS